MVYCLWVFCAGLAVVTLVLLIKLALIRNAAKEIEEQFAEKVENETNTLIGIASRDTGMRKLADALNEELRLFHEERRRFIRGDKEVKEAIANISHDIRTPLTAICGYLDLLKSEDMSDDARRYICLIENRAGALRNLTEELFQYSVVVSVEEGEKEKLSVNEVLQESLAGFYVSFKEKDIIPEIHLPEERVERSMNRSALLRIFGNIISNAIKYSGGDFCVHMEREGIITFSNRTDSLTPVTAARLFDRFYTVETGKGSVGLGLAIAKILTEQQGGRIRAEYESGRLKVILDLEAEQK